MLRSIRLQALPTFRAELPDLSGMKRGFPEIDIRIDIATGDVVVSAADVDDRALEDRVSA
jgi:hypothetical protein